MQIKTENREHLSQVSTDEKRGLPAVRLSKHQNNKSVMNGQILYTSILPAFRFLGNRGLLEHISLLQSYKIKKQHESLEKKKKKKTVAH